MDARPDVPDPQHDRHVAFPDDQAAQPPPENWWAPAPAPPPSQTALPSGKSVAWWAIVGVFLFGVFMSQGHGTEAGSSSEPPGGSSIVEPGGRVDLLAEPAALSSSSFAADDAPLYSILPGTTSFRLEVVGTDPTGSIDVASEYSGTQVATQEQLPYAGVLTRANPDEVLSITVHSAYDQRRVQCRVYVEDALVAIGTGDGVATCEVPRVR